MAEIIFQNEKDASSLYNHLIQRLEQEYRPYILLIEDRNIFKLKIKGVKFQDIWKIRDIFFDFVCTIKKEDWLRNIIMEKYFFDDPDEQQGIIDIVYSIMEGSRKDLEIFLKPSANEKSGLREAVGQMLLEEISFSFESFVHFRLRPYIKELERYVEVAIDEYKMEQEYQIFIQTLRDFLSERPEKMNCVHVVFDEEITFYNESFLEMKRSELAKMVDRKLLFNHPVYVDSVSIAPLLSIAPGRIVIYARDPEQPLIRTIQNIFEERVSIRSVPELAEMKKNLTL